MEKADTYNPYGWLAVLSRGLGLLMAYVSHSVPTKPRMTKPGNSDIGLGVRNILKDRVRD